jgi:nucleotide-binding universal stress UspA family protein
MDRHILVPLDGSRRAAAALPYAVTLARATDTAIRLLAVAPQGRGGQRAAACTTYLDAVAATLRSDSTAVTTAVRQGNPAHEILAASGSEGCALIAVSTHGDTGLERLRMGSVAHHVVRHATIPVLVVRPTDEAATEGAATITQITATLDGSDFAETALRPAALIAAALGIPLRLLRVIPNVLFTAEEWDAGWGGWYPESEAIEQDEERWVAEYLDATAARLRSPGLEVRTEWQHSVTNRAAETIAAVVEEEPTGLVAMASHGRGGVLRWAIGSTAEETLDRVRCPILIVRSGAAATEQVSARPAVTMQSR